MLEPESGLADETRSDGTHEVLVCETLQIARYGGTTRRFGKLDNGAGVEDFALDRAPRERRARITVEAVEPSAEQPVQARRQRERIQVARQRADAARLAQHALVEEHRDQLLGEQRVSRRRPGKPRAHRRRRVTQQAREDRVDVASAERLQPDCDLPVRAQFEQLGPGQAEQQDRDVGDRRRQPGEQAEKRRLGPVDVVDDHHEGPRVGPGSHEMADRPLGLRSRRRALREPEQLRDLGGDDAAVCAALDVGLDKLARLRDRVLVVDPCELPHDLADRPEGDPLAVRQAPAAHDPPPVTDLRDELRGQARLPDARFTDDGDETAFPLRDHGLELPLEQLQLVLASGKRGPRPPRHRSDVAHPEQPVGRDQLGLALGVDRRRRLGVHCASNEPISALAEQHLAGACRLLQPRGDVDGIAGHEGLAARRVTRDDLAGVDADPQRDRLADPPLELLVQHGEASLHLERGPARAQRIVLMGFRHAENGQHCIADELLHGATVPLERGPHLVEVREHQAPHRLRVDLLAECGRARQVTEHERRQLPALDHRHRQRGPTETTVAKPFRALASAIRTGEHRYKPMAFAARNTDSRCDSSLLSVTCCERKTSSMPATRSHSAWPTWLGRQGFHARISAASSDVPSASRRMRTC